MSNQDKTGEEDAFRRDVFALTRCIPKGRVSTYGAIARSLGAVGASRRVGWVLNGSFDALPLVPAHRVVNRQGLLTGSMHFPADRPMAETLSREGVRVEEGKVCDFEEVFWDPMVALNWELEK